LIAPGFKTPAIAKTHFLMSRTTSVGFVRLAQKASGASRFRAFALVVHGFLYSVRQLRHLVGLRECTASSFGFIPYDIDKRAGCARWTACPQLPFPYSTDSDSNQGGELVLRQAQRQPRFARIGLVWLTRCTIAFVVFPET
jgi:hypothetical protein